MKLVAQPTREQLAKAIHDWIAFGEPPALEFAEEDVEAGATVVREFVATIYAIEQKDDGFEISAEARYEKLMRGFVRLVIFTVSYET